MPTKKPKKLNQTQMEVMHEEMNQNFKAIVQGIQSFERKFDQKIDNLDRKLDDRIDRLEAKMDSNFKTVFSQMSNFAVHSRH